MGALAAVILAAGQGTRMKSDLPKVLHRICGRPMAGYVLKALRRAGVDRIIMVVGHQGEKVAEAHPGPSTSANPLYSFKFKAEKAGTFSVKLKDTDGDTGESTVKLELA